MSHYKPYPAYKDSGVEWLGRVPEHWDIVPLKWCFECLDGRRVPLNSEQRADIKGEVPYWGSGGIVDHIDQFIFDEPLVLLGEDGAPFFDRDRPVAYAIEGHSWINNHIHVLRPLTDYPVAWFVHALNCVEYRHYIDGSTRDKLTQDDMKSIALVIPGTPDEATKAVAHLGRETARIDALVAKKTRFIELLREKRQALITHAVTKGLDPNVKMKDSGVEWLGEVPEHWGVKQLKYLATHIGSGKTPSGGAEVYIDSGVLFLRSQNVYEDGLRLDDAAFISDQVDEEMRWSRVKPNDVLLNITGASIGRSCLVPEVFQRANVNQHVCIVRCESTLVSKWVSLCLPSTAIQAQIDFSQNGAGREGLNFEQIGNMLVALPSAEEIDEIACWLDHETVRIDALIGKTEHSIVLLKERRSALITAAVTGHIDLREAV